jgi:hypothetical protein
VDDVSVDCPGCSQTVGVPGHYVGKNWRCPACKHGFVPDPAVHVERPPLDAQQGPGAVAHSAPVSPDAAASAGAPSMGSSLGLLATVFVAGAALGSAATWLLLTR